MESLPSIESQTIIADRIRHFYILRFVVLLLLAATGITLICFTLTSFLAASRLTPTLANTTQAILQVESQLTDLNSKIDANALEQASMQVKRNSRADNRSTFWSISAAIFGAFKNGMNPMAEYQQYKKWTEELDVRDAELRTRASQLQRDFGPLKKRHGALSAAHERISSEIEHLITRRNWCAVFAVGVILALLLAYTIRPRDIVISTLYSPSPLLQSIGTSVSQPQALPDATQKTSVDQ
jgi:hypothetical protein